MFQKLFDIPKKIESVVLISLTLMVWMLLAVWILGGMTFYAFFLMMIITILLYFCIFCLFLKDEVNRKKILATVLGVNLGVMILGMVFSAIFSDKKSEIYPKLTNKQCLTMEELAKDKNADLLSIIPQFYLVNGSDGVELRWNSVAEVDGYAIFRRGKEEKDFSCIATLMNPATTFFLDVSMLPNCDYTYAVSTIVDGKTGKCVPIDWKSGIKRPEVSLTNKGETVLLEWSWIQGVKDYHVYRKETNGGKYEEIACIPDGEVLLFEDTPPAFGVKYTYAVRGHIGEIKGFIRAKNVTLTMAKTTAEGVCTEEGVSLKWQPVEYAESYNIYRKSVTEKNAKIANVTTDTLQYLDSTVNGETEYTYTVRAVRGRYQNKCDAIVVTTGSFASRDQELQNEQDKQIAESLERITLTLATGGSDDKATVKLSWNKASAGDGYHIYRKEEGEEQDTLINTVTDLNTTSYTDENVEKGKSYLYYVRAFVGAYEGSGSGSKIELK